MMGRNSQKKSETRQIVETFRDGSRTNAMTDMVMLTPRMSYSATGGQGSNGAASRTDLSHGHSRARCSLSPYQGKPMRSENPECGHQSRHNHGNGGSQVSGPSWWDAEAAADCAKDAVDDEGLVFNDLERTGLCQLGRLGYPWILEPVGNKRLWLQMTQESYTGRENSARSEPNPWMTVSWLA